MFRLLLYFKLLLCITHLVTLGALDEIVPPSHMQKLHELATMSKKKEFYRILGGHHNDCFETPGYYQVCFYIFLVTTQICFVWSSQLYLLQKFRDHLTDIGIFDTSVAPVCGIQPTAGDNSQKSPITSSPRVESSDDDFDKITHDEVAEVAEHFAIPSINTKYQGLHL